MQEGVQQAFVIFLFLLLFFVLFDHIRIAQLWGAVGAPNTLATVLELWSTHIPYICILTINSRNIWHF